MRGLASAAPQAWWPCRRGARRRGPPVGSCISSAATPAPPHSSCDDVERRGGHLNSRPLPPVCPTVLVMIGTPSCCGQTPFQSRDTNPPPRSTNLLGFLDLDKSIETSVSLGIGLLGRRIANLPTTVGPRGQQVCPAMHCGDAHVRWSQRPSARRPRKTALPLPTSQPSTRCSPQGSALGERNERCATLPLCSIPPRETPIPSSGTRAGASALLYAAGGDRAARGVHCEKRRSVLIVGLYFSIPCRTCSHPRR